MEKYKHNKESEEGYIDLIPILENLYISPEEFLNLNNPEHALVLSEHGDTVLQNK